MRPWWDFLCFIAIGTCLVLTCLAASEYLIVQRVQATFAEENAQAMKRSALRKIKLARP
jgi:hypothetical protein